MIRKIVFIGLILFGFGCAVTATQPQIPISNIDLKSLALSPTPFYNAPLRTPTPEPTSAPLVFPSPSLSPSPNKRQFKISINSEITKEKQEKIRVAINEWNDAFGYEVFSFDSGDYLLDISLSTYLGDIGPTVVGVYKGNICRDSTITLFSALTLEKTRLVTLHELGHALGLKHSDGAEDVMYYRVGTRKLSENDIARAKAVESACIRIEIKQNESRCRG